MSESKEISMTEPVIMLELDNSLTAPDEWENTIWKFYPEGEYSIVENYYSDRSESYHGTLSEKEQNELARLLKGITAWYKSPKRREGRTILNFTKDGCYWTLTDRSADHNPIFHYADLFHYPDYEAFISFMNKIGLNNDERSDSVL